jgi:dihydrolipoamide dehydrogenase
MNRISVDVAVIGAGSAGLTAFFAARTHTTSLLLIDGGPYGTTCARVGCMPSKLLVAAANAAHDARHAGLFGVHVGSLEVDGRAVMRRVQAERDRFVGSVVNSTESIPAEQRLLGQARFTGPNTLLVNEETEVQARAIVIATGSRPFVPAALQAAADRLDTSDSIFEWDTLPASVAVVGSGAIGLELGQALHRLGVQVELFGRGEQAGMLSDPDLAKLATQIFSSELKLHLQSEVQQVTRHAQGVTLHVRGQDGQESVHHHERLLCATGRTPNLDRLDLAKTGLKLNARGIPEYDPLTMRCGDSAIFIAGDADNERPVLHEATGQGRIAGDNAGAWPKAYPGVRHTFLGIAFTEPQMAMVGAGPAELKGKDFVTGHVDFDEQGRSRVMGENLGALYLYADRLSGRLLGAQMVGPRAEHLAHLLAWSLESNLSVEQMLRMPFYHPVVEEALRTALKDAREHMKQPPPAIEHCDDCTPGV